jgi:hypothetical protein
MICHCPCSFCPLRRTINESPMDTTHPSPIFLHHDHGRSRGAGERQPSLSPPPDHIWKQRRAAGRFAAAHRIQPDEQPLHVSRAFPWPPPGLLCAAERPQVDRLGRELWQSSDGIVGRRRASGGLGNEGEGGKEKPGLLSPGRYCSAFGAPNDGRPWAGADPGTARFAAWDERSFCIRLSSPAIVVRVKGKSVCCEADTACAAERMRLCCEL